MTSPAAEVARIKAEFAARDALWLLAIRSRLREGPAITVELAQACKVQRVDKGKFWAFLFGHKRAGTLITVGTKPGPNGCPNSVWGLPAVTDLLSLPRAGEYACILADPPWRYEVWSGETAVKRRNGHGTNVSAAIHYQTMSAEEIAALPVAKLAAPDCVLFIWVTWPTLLQAIELISTWGFAYKTCAFDWMKAHVGQIDMFRDDADALMGMGYWTRANSEPCLLATRGKPKRLSKGVRQDIIEPRREHSRKPDCVHDRIERLVAGPYLELFARQQRPGWDCWGNETNKFTEAA